MRGRARAAFFAFAGLLAIAPASAAAAMPLSSGPARPAAVANQPLTWSIVASPNRTAAGRHHFNPLNGISCVSATDCTTVGYSTWRGSLKTLVESWNGTAWSIVPSPNRAFRDILLGVSCTSASACTTVGYTYGRDTSYYRTLAESWNGTTWSIVPSPNPSPVKGTDRLIGVSCVSASDCTAVGDYTTTDGKTAPLIEAWDGTTWSVTRSPRKGPSSVLSSVSCPTSDACTAVGWYKTSGGSTKALAENWNGAKWSVVPSPGTFSYSALNGVSCPAADSCAAVGESDTGNSSLQTLAENWNGTAWSIVPSPSPGGTKASNSLSGVSCAASDDCTAVGNFSGPGNGIPEQTIVEAWDGSAWSVTSSPNEGRSSMLSGVSCASSATCMADGSYGYHDRTLTELGS
jgi:hypothetical protein